MKSLVTQHTRYDYVPLTERKDYSWPGGKRLAFCITTNVEVFAFGKGRGHDNAKHGEPQTQRNYSWRDYGNRIGIWRLFDLAEELDMPLAHNANSLLYEHAPQIMARIRRRGDEIVGHGRTNSENLQDFRWEAGRSARDRGSDRDVCAARRQAGQGLDGRGHLREPVDRRPAQGSGLHLRHGLAVRRPADLDAHALRADTFRALSRPSSTIRRRSSIASTPRASSATCWSTSSRRWSSRASAIRWCATSRSIPTCSATRSGCGRCARRSSIASPQAHGPRLEVQAGGHRRLLLRPGARDRSGKLSTRRCCPGSRAGFDRDARFAGAARGLTPSSC